MTDKISLLYEDHSTFDPLPCLCFVCALFKNEYFKIQRNWIVAIMGLVLLFIQHVIFSSNYKVMISFFPPKTFSYTCEFGFLKPYIKNWRCVCILTCIDLFTVSLQISEDPLISGKVKRAVEHGILYWQLSWNRTTFRLNFKHRRNWLVNKSWVFTSMCVYISAELLLISVMELILWACSSLKCVSTAAPAMLYTHEYFCLGLFICCSMLYNFRWKLHKTLKSKNNGQREKKNQVE